MSAGPAAPYAVELQGLTKAFRDCVANDGVNLRVRAGSIHGVIGENGAGKSTAMKMLYGLYAPDSGRIIVEGQERHWRSPKDALAAGIGMVHQHFMLAGPHSALDNILLGEEPVRGAGLPRFLLPLDRARARAKLEALGRQYGLPVDWDAPVERLPVGIQQRIEILKLLYRDARILILDEPTAVLTPHETHELFANLRKLKAEGKTIVIITHKLKEVMSFTDRVTVLRAGRTTGEVETASSSPQELADLMVGRRVALNVEVPPQPELGAPVLELEGVTLEAARGAPRPRLDRISLAVRAGEVVGIAGVEGNGQSELIQAILHPSDHACRSEGRVRVLGRDVTGWRADAIKELGVGVVPEDRHREGLLLEQPLTENFVLGLQRRAPFSARGLLQPAAIRAATARALDEYDVRPRAVDARAGELSGGNQQKLIIARELAREPRFLIAAQPTRGVDVGAIEFIHQRILAARTQGAGVLLISSELDEILALSDRILVFYEGKVAGEFRRGQTDEKKLGLALGGGGRA
jgi:simple sugar transport system ATP-binding protein